MKLKKWLLGLVTFAAMAVLCAVCVGAETYGDFNYSVLDDGTVEITKYIGSAEKVDIPAEIDGKSVTSIGFDTFSGCTSLSTINVATGNKNYVSVNGVLYNKDKTAIIRYPAGKKDKNYKIPDGVMSIDSKAFANNTTLTSVTIPNSVTSIGRGAFVGCTSLTSITIPNSVTSIDSYTFSGCTNLTSITIPNSVMSIGDYAFLDCTSLKSITIPASVTYIGDGAIGYYVDKINWIYNRITGFEIKYTKNTYGHWYATKNGFSDESCSITNELADGTLAIKYAGRDKTYVIPAEIDGKRVTKIDYAAFSYCDNLESITIPDSVTSIDYSAFRGCSNLTRIMIPDSVRTIDGYAFQDCTSLKSIKIPNSVTSISSCAFYGCTSLTSITIPDSVTSIDYQAFTYCTSLKSITIPDSVTYIGDSAFYGCRSLTSIMIPDSVRTIGGCAFQDCTSLKSIKIPNSVTSISSCAFYGCTSLTSITIPDSVTSIENDAFTNCTSLTSITIPNSVTYISGGDFSGCASLTAINVTTGNQSYASANGVLYSKDKTKLIYYPKGKKDKNCKIPDGVMSIDSKAFANNTTLTSVTIPNSVTSIGGGAFVGCTSLTSITIPNSVTSIDSYTFSGCTNLTSITIPDSVTEIGWGAFVDCISLKNVTIPKSVTGIYDNAFGYYYDNGYKKIDDFKICCYSGTAGEKYAKYNDFDYVLLDKLPTLAKITGVKLGGRAADALRINWTKNASADGYIVEMYQNGKWARVAKIIDSTTATFRKAGLRASTVYKFRVRAYKMSGSTAIYSNYSAELSARTNPSVMKGAKLGGRAADALRINWTKNASGDGYIVEMYKNGKWVRAAKITNKNTTTFRKAGLKASTVYKFRVRAYKMSGKTALYGNYSATVTARTNPSIMKGVKIAGKAKDALRVNWTKNTSAQGYIVEMYKGGKWVRAAKITNGNATTFRKAGLAKNTTYKFRVKAYYMSGKTALYGNYGSVSGRTLAK